MLFGARAALLRREFNPIVYGVEALDNLYAVHAVARLLTTWRRPLVRLRRSGDSAEADFGPDVATGFLSTTDIAAWLGSSTAFVVTLYDQTGNGRHSTQVTAGNQHALSLAGVFPVLQTDGNDVQATDVAWARNASAASIVLVSKYGAAGAATQQGAGVNNSASGSRAILGRAATGLSGVFRAYGRRLDADSLQNTTGLTGDDNWHVQIARWDWANAALYHRVDGLTEVNASFQTAGSTSNTDSSSAGIGNAVAGGTVPVFSGGQFSAAIWTRDLLTTAEDADLVTSLAALKQ